MLPVLSVHLGLVKVLVHSGIHQCWLVESNQSATDQFWKDLYIDLLQYKQGYGRPLTEGVQGQLTFVTSPPA